MTVPITAYITAADDRGCTRQSPLSGKTFRKKDSPAKIGAANRKPYQRMANWPMESMTGSMCQWISMVLPFDHCEQKVIRSQGALNEATPWSTPNQQSGAVLIRTDHRNILHPRPRLKLLIFSRLSVDPQIC